MQIEIEFDIYDDVFFMKDNQVSSDELEEIRVIRFIEKNMFDKIKTIKTYKTFNNGEFLEGAIFKTKQDLLNSL